MKKLVLVGGGGHCKSVLDVVLRMKEYDEIVITDPDISAGTNVMGVRVVGTDDELPRLREDGFEYAFITVGSIKSTKLRRKLAKKLEELNYTFPVICDPFAVVSEHAIIEKGTFIGKNVVINVETHIGQHCIINTGTIIEHECTVGEFTHVAVGAILCGDCHVETDCLIGAGSTVIQGVSVGKECIVGAGALVTKNTPDCCMVVGVPAKVV